MDEIIPEKGALYIRNPSTSKMKCSNCNKEAKKLVPIYEYADNLSIYKILFYCRQCFYYYIHGAND